jgi:hypothetical protein
MHTAGVAWTDQKGKNTVVMWYNPENTHRIASILVPKTSIKNPQGVSKCITFYTHEGASCLGTKRSALTDG